jgi:hypothetical protein
VEERHELLEDARTRLDVSIEDLWREYFALGGDASPLELEAFLQGALNPPRREYDILAHTLNERFMQRGQDHPIPLVTGQL